MSTKFYDRLSALEKAISRGPEADALETFVELTMRDKALYEYAFDNLGDTAWIRPLSERGFFSKPPSAIREGDTISFPWWPESRYLARVAGLDPELVAAVCVNLPSTDNIRVHSDVIDVALQVPTVLATKIAERELVWVLEQDRLFLLVPRKLGQLVSGLATGGDAATALRLLTALIEVRSSTSSRGKSRSARTKASSEPATRVEAYEYVELLQKQVPVVREHKPREVFDVLCTQLQRFVEFSRRPDEEPGAEDFSYIWRKAIESDEWENHDVRDQLVTAVRDATLNLAAQFPEQVPPIVESLEARKWHVFKRIALHLLASREGGYDDLVNARIRDIESFESSGVQHEYEELLRKRFALAPIDVRNEILGWIEVGPDIEEFKQAVERWNGKKISDDDVVRFAEQWRLEKLNVISAGLDGEWKARFDELIQKFGQPESDRDRVRFSSGYSSPKSTDELSRMAVAELIAYLREWRPSDDGSYEGLARTLTSVVAENPAPYSNEAAAFRLDEPTYVRALLFGFRDAAKQGRSFTWDGVLQLAAWAIEHPVDEEGVVRVQERDPGWRWARQAVADLLSDGFEGAEGIPIRLRESVWPLLRTLLKDPIAEDDDEFDPATRSLNTTRGQAMHAAIRYGLWVRKTHESDAEFLGRGFEAIPELRDALNEHLDPMHESSATIRAVYGQWFPWLTLLDAGWAAGAADRIFPTSDAERKLWRAAWETYITFCRPYDNVFDLIAAKYAHAVAVLEKPVESNSRHDYEDRLAEHLMVLYWRGKVALLEPPSLLPAFYARAWPQLRAHAAAFIGQSLTHDSAKVPESISNRLMNLWQSRIESYQQSQDASSFEEELTEFGWWFVSRRFPDEWALAQLTSTLQVFGKIDPDWQVVKAMAEMVKVNPIAVLNALRLMVEGGRDDSALYGWQDAPRTILETAMRTGDPNVQDVAEDLIDRLGAMGHRQFRDLIRQRT